MDRSDDWTPADEEEWRRTHPRPPTSADEELLEADTPAIVSQLDDVARVHRIDEELMAGFDRLAHIGRAVSIFGSARTPRTDPMYAKARETAAALGGAGFAIITGGGPGIMEAANRGAVDSGVTSVGLNIELPFEQGMNQWVTLGMEFDYFFTRKLMFARAASAWVVFPGGYGTLDELFEVLTLLQTGKARQFPVILVGSEDWGGLRDWLRGTVLAAGRIDAADLDLFHLCDDSAEVVEIVSLASRR